MAANNIQVLLAAALAGAGVAYGPTFVFGERIVAGDLVALLPDHRTSGLAIHAIYPSAQYLAEGTPLHRPSDREFPGRAALGSRARDIRRDGGVSSYGMLRIFSLDQSQQGGVASTRNRGAASHAERTDTRAQVARANRSYASGS